jgi:hypothetical protein
LILAYVGIIDDEHGALVAESVTESTTIKGKAKATKAMILDPRVRIRDAYLFVSPVVCDIPFVRGSSLTVDELPDKTTCCSYLGTIAIYT